MQTYWKDYQGDDASLWSHEWNKHGTCVSTLETQCYDSYVSQQEVVDYFDVAVEVFKSRPSYDVSSTCFDRCSACIFLTDEFG